MNTKAEQAYWEGCRDGALGLRFAPWKFPGNEDSYTAGYDAGEDSVC